MFKVADRYKFGYVPKKVNGQVVYPDSFLCPKCCSELKVNTMYNFVKCPFCGFCSRF